MQIGKILSKNAHERGGGIKCPRLVPNLNSNIIYPVKLLAAKFRLNLHQKYIVYYRKSDSMMSFMQSSFFFSILSFYLPSYFKFILLIFFWRIRKQGFGLRSAFGDRFDPNPGRFFQAGFGFLVDRIQTGYI